MQNHRQLDVWRRAMDYAVRVYEFSAQLPHDERHNLIVQLRKAATSVPLNVAEGAGCATDAEFVRFLSFSYRSVKEVVTCLELCERLFPSLPQSAAPELIEEGDRLARMTYGLIQRLREPVREPRAGSR